MAKRKITPMMEQYLAVRRELPADTLLLFRLGDFYELFEDDAKRGAELLGITLTHRNGQPMAGIPYHAADTYLQKVLAQGIKVAICDQLEAPKPGKLVKRALTRILTPGTTLEDHQLTANRHHYLLALDAEKTALAAWLDLSTGDLQVASERDPERLASLLAALDPREILLPESWEHGDAPALLQPILHSLSGKPRSTLPDYHFDQPEGAKRVLETLGVLNLTGFGLETSHAALGTAGAVLQYAAVTLCAPPANIRRLRAVSSQATVLLDAATQRHLEVFKDSDGQRAGSLLAAMDGTVTAPGARCLERWLAAPPRELDTIEARQAAVGSFLSAPALAAEAQAYLKNVRDLPRILGRLRNRLRNPRELGAIRDTLLTLPDVTQTLAAFDDPAITHWTRQIELFPDLRAELEVALAEELPSQVQDGGIIAPGFDEELDRLRGLGQDSREWLAEFEAGEQARTGIKNLRIKYNNAFGYFIEVTKSNLALVPEDYIRKQTMTNAERYTTPGLKEKEREILHAEEHALAREETLFKAVVARILEDADALEATAEALASLDVLLGWASLARRWDYTRPQFVAEAVAEIEAGRHPVIEQMMAQARQRGEAGAQDFVPNDVALASDDAQIAVLTGPNMAGKSTYIRQVALLTLMAHTGAWVPASHCRLGLVDRIFSRVGASDELAKGNSTFMVEMNETANILHHATARSLIVLDEIGRGTSTYDGLAIAWAVVEFLHGKDENSAFADAGPMTLFATHYHELTQLALQLPRVRNFRVAVKEWNDQIIFVRQVVPGGADRSYGIQVARLAGLPESVVNRATAILAKLEADPAQHNVLKRRLKVIKDAEKAGEKPQLELF